MRKGISCLVFGAVVALAACGDDDDAASSQPSDPAGPAVVATTAEPASADTVSSTPADDTEATATADSAAATATADSAAADAAAADPDAEPFRIGWSNQDEGAQAAPGNTDGIRAAVEYINAELGGIGGHPVELVECPVGADEASSQTCGQQFANDDSIAMVMRGEVLSGAAFTDPVLAAGKTIVGTLALTQADFTATGDIYFWGATSTAAIAGLATFINDHGNETFGIEITTIAVPVVDSESGQAAVGLLEQGLGSGYEVVAVPVNEAAGDILPQLQASGASTADIVVPLLAEAQCIKFAQAFDTLGLETPVLSAAPCFTYGTLAEIGEQLEGWYTVTATHHVLQGRGVDDRVDQFLDQWETYGTGNEPLNYTDWGFSVTLGVHDALDAIPFEELTPEAIASAIRGFDQPLSNTSTPIQCPGPIYPPVCLNEVSAYLFEDGRLNKILDGAVLRPGEQS